MNDQTMDITTVDGEETDLVIAHDPAEGLTIVDPEAMPDLDAADEGMDVAPRYMEFKAVGERIRGFYVGKSTITSKKNNETKIVPSVVIQNKDGFFLNSGASLVDQLGKIKPGTPVQITYRGTEKTSRGNDVKKYEVKLLNLKGVVPVATFEKPAQVQPQDNPGEPMFKTYEELLAKAGSELKLEAQEVKAILTRVGFTGFRPSKSAEMWRVLNISSEEIPF